MEVFGARLDAAVKAEVAFVASEVGFSPSQLARIAIVELVEEARRRLGEPGYYMELAQRSRHAHAKAA
jgi:hypothetical protein